MTALVVNAHGAPNSFARHVQVDPTIAVELVQKVRSWVEACDKVNAERTSENVIERDAQAERLRKHFRVMKLLHNL